MARGISTGIISRSECGVYESYNAGLFRSIAESFMLEPIVGEKNPLFRSSLWTIVKWDNKYKIAF